MTTTYIAGSDFPDLAVTWRDTSGRVIDFTGWTITVKVATRTHAAAAFTKTTGVTASATAPNLVVVWNDGELDSLASGSYVIQIEAALGGKKRYMQTPLELKPRVT